LNLLELEQSLTTKTLYALLKHKHDVNFDDLVAYLYLFDYLFVVDDDVVNFPCDIELYAPIVLDIHENDFRELVIPKMISLTHILIEIIEKSATLNCDSVCVYAVLTLLNHYEVGCLLVSKNYGKERMELSQRLVELFESKALFFYLQILLKYSNHNQKLLFKYIATEIRDNNMIQVGQRTIIADYMIEFMYLNY
jgi:hypothetical protein